MASKAIIGLSEFFNYFKKGSEEEKAFDTVYHGYTININAAGGRTKMKALVRALRLAADGIKRDTGLDKV